MMLTVIGKVIKEISRCNNVYIYDIECKNDTISFVSYGIKISALYEIEVSYQKKISNKYGQQNEIIFVKHIKLLDNKSLLKMMTNVIDLSPAFSKNIIEKYPTNIIDMLLYKTEDLESLKFRGIKIDDQIKKINKWKCQSSVEIDVFMAEHGIHSKYRKNLIEKFKNVTDIEKRMYDMYILCKVPLKICDNAALFLGYNNDDPKRIDAFIKMVFKTNKGISYFTLKGIKFACRDYAYINVSELIKSMKRIKFENVEYFTTSEFFFQEKEIEKRCLKLVKNEPVHMIKGKKSYRIANAYEVADTELDNKQIQAVNTALKNCLSIVSGAPGTGKTSIISHIARQLSPKNVMIYILAPTGAAVEKIRADESLQDLKNGNLISISTIHSFLWNNELNNDKKSDFDGIEDIKSIHDEFIFFIDEMSMVCTDVMWRFFNTTKVIQDKMRLILLGDENQLPSIDAGELLQDMINSKHIPYTILEKNYRSKKCPAVINNAKLVLDGKELQPDSKELILIHSDKDEMYLNLEKIIDSFEIDYKKSCILIPTKKNGICTIEANKNLQHKYNPLGNRIFSNYVFRTHDKIMHKKNDKKLGIYNGSILVVDQKRNDRMACKYYEDDSNLYGKKTKSITYDDENLLEQIELAYAMTVHKAQGKGYDDVVVVIHSSMGDRLLSRNLLYTAITRAKKRCIILADSAGLQKCSKKRSIRVTNLFKNLEC
uniref:UvrD-like helicase C-terminal domain-containing protein n=1 Tax=viral metagenome TaxID=1070528 RepID=A0A6C0CCJ9_9ZZZZ